MDGLNSLMTWFVENEAALSGVAATVVILGFVASPLGAGLRGLVRRWALSSSDFVEEPTAQPPVTDIQTPLEPEAGRPSVAVLPFVSSSDDKDSEIFADGMTNDVIRALGHVPGFFVTSSNSTFVYQGQSVDTRQIGRDLGVRYVVEGRIQSAGSVVRINAELVEAKSGDQIWSEQFSGDLSDIFALQDDVTRSIAGQLQPELMKAEWRRSSHIPTENLDAWTLLHSARMRFMVGHSREAVEESIQLAEAALELDPGYADAHGFLTVAIMNHVLIRWSDDPERDQERCETHCRKALELDPENADVLYAAAYLNLNMGNAQAAMQQIDQCCAINPNDAFAQATRGLILGLVERGEEGLEVAGLALHLSPRDPRTYYLQSFVAYIHVTLEQYGDAEQILFQSLRQNESYFWSLWQYVLVLAMQGKAAEARDTVPQLQRIAPSFSLEVFENMIKSFHRDPTAERAEIIDRWVDSLRGIWPS